jgi:hypothetical protein
MDRIFDPGKIASETGTINSIFNRMNYLNRGIGKIYRRYSLRPVCLMVFISLCAINASLAQNTSYEFWPETDIWYTLNPAWRLSAFIPITKYNESKDRDLNIYLQADYKFGRTKYSAVRRLVDENKEQVMKAWMVRGGFMEGWSLGDAADRYTEDMLFGEIHRRIPLKGQILLSHRLRIDTRWVGDDPKFSYRFRYRVMVEKEFTVGRGSIVPYVNAEPYWDSRYSTFNRVRVIGGATGVWGRRFAFEGNITYQYDSHYDTENLWALNLILHVN